LLKANLEIFKLYWSVKSYTKLLPSFFMPINTTLQLSKQEIKDLIISWMSMQKTHLQPLEDSCTHDALTLSSLACSKCEQS